ncbi:hypothetical protein EDD36DRAFT_303674 [Exophiala viscosa]|uniref:Uncharacterized protein n=1 Tax=Exophiala viscosa TaxID=2486360 RepID=A0AAN6DRK3_9EURO|nr:hypothetical protein EDD36DRAFT_303674 [Exophiala viscosa]
MDEQNDNMLFILSSPPPDEPQPITTLRSQAHDLISNISLDTLPTTLQDVLSQIIKPLFTKTHRNLTSTGRKNLVSNTPSFLSPRFEVDEPERWKTNFTVPLLTYILSAYARLLSDSRKSVIEAHFHLLVPAILNMIDDTDATYKASGANLLTTLCEIVRSLQSDIIRRTGLGDVFFDALKTNFNLLPTLTPEEDSLGILGAVVPAYFALLDITTNTDTNIDAKQRKAGTDRLTWLYRHGIISGIEHLSSSGSFSSTISVPLTTFLLAQIPAVFERMGMTSVRHFQELLPMLRAGLMDPFILAAPGMVLAALDVLDCVIRVGEPRIKEKWWPEILRGAVGCWCNCCDEPLSRRRDGSEVEEVMGRLRGVVVSLGKVVDREVWEDVLMRLIDEERELEELVGTQRAIKKRVQKREDEGNGDQLTSTV